MIPQISARHSLSKAGVIRLAAVSYLNTRPLIWPIETGEISGFELTKDVPSRLPALVESGAADLGLLPMGYCLRHPELTLVKGAGIACRGAVKSILLLTRGPIKDVRHIATTTTSMSSVLLLRVLLHRHFHHNAELVPSDRPDYLLHRAEVDGALLIGDPALQIGSCGLRVYDLGEEWFSLTGLPFVFALWAGLDPEIAERAGPELVRAMRLGRAAIPKIASDAAPSLGLSSEFCADYLTHSIVHEVGDPEMKGYNTFREFVHAEPSLYTDSFQEKL